MERLVLDYWMVCITLIDALHCSLAHLF